MGSSEKLRLAHGSGGRLTAELIEGFFGDGFEPGELDDAAAFSLGKERLAFTTDSFVVEPLFFPGGDIGRLAVFGTVNDLAAQGAEPAYLSLAVVGSEGFPLERLRRIMESVSRAAVEAGVRVVTGDTKVIERGGLTGLILNTAGVGRVRDGADISAERVEAGDIVVVTGPLGDHEAAVLCHRYDFGVDHIKSDCASVAQPAAAVIETVGPGLRWMRDPTRGGLATVLNELASQIGARVEATESAIPISPAVRDAADILGLDPLYLACEGRLVFVVAPESAEETVEALRKRGGCPDAVAIGRVVEVGTERPRVELKTEFGGRRILRYLAADQQPRIC